MRTFKIDGLQVQVDEKVIDFLKEEIYGHDLDDQTIITKEVELLIDEFNYNDISELTLSWNENDNKYEVEVKHIEMKLKDYLESLFQSNQYRHEKPLRVDIVNYDEGYILFSGTIEWIVSDFVQDNLVVVKVEDNNIWVREVK